MTPEQQTLERGMRALGWEHAAPASICWIEPLPREDHRSWITLDRRLPSYLASKLRAEIVLRGAPWFGRYVKHLLVKLDEKGDPQDLMVGFSYTDLQGVLYYLTDYDHINAACDALEGEA